MPEQFIKFWRKFEHTTRPYIHRDDEAGMEMLEQRGLLDKTTRNVDAYVRRGLLGSKPNTTMHLNLMPVPYAGNIRTSKIVLLFSNPSLSCADYFYEAKQDTPYWNAHLATIRQTLGRRAYPFMSLDPQFCWHSGFDYWEKRLRWIVQQLLAAEETSSPAYTYTDALREVSSNVAVIQLMPYRSRKFPGPAVRLPSCQAAREFVDRISKEGDRLILPIRRARDWRLKRDEPSNRAAWFTNRTNTRILQKLLEIRRKKNS